MLNVGMLELTPYHYSMTSYQQQSSLNEPVQSALHLQHQETVLLPIQIKPKFCLILTLKMPILLCMKKKSLFDSNPYLQDPRKYRDSLVTSVSSSTAIETGASVKSISQQITDVSGSHLFPASTKPESNAQ